MQWRQAAVCLSFLFLSASGACTLRPGPAPEVSPTTPTDTPVPSPLPTGTPILPTSTPACTETVGGLETQEVTSEYMPVPLRVLVYLPPCYGNRSGARYPVVYLFHGQFYDETQWMQLGAAATADRLISAGAIAPMLIVMPFDPYPYQPYEYGFDEAFIRDLLPYIDAHYRTQADREQRALGGLSRGSSWALHFGLSQPELFGRFGMHSPVIFASDGLLVEKWLDIIPPENVPQIYLDVSENDQNLQNTFWLENILTTRGILHEWHLNPGFHTDEYWAAHVEEYLRWYAFDWTSTP